ncbi:Thiol-disulfide oxidoreductase ResA [Pirellula sp. SH-Sr6A]|uniref:redoxin family protein n=1 Tax=Pirellula sp. SH-Sr6A TaxID=1632865 RepID=UPI00078D5ADE|nr:redoxin family protein [Pirellula sp. SH-Sr6A]AMV32761.1 Thiol-disulfide oxidoreductase ResA [Pirellula sp. SH-Sr6A]
MSQQPKVWLTGWIRSNLAWSRWASIPAAAIVLSVAGPTASGVDVDPQVSKALGYKPRQSNVVYDQVGEKEAESCTSRYESKNGVDGLTVFGPNGQMLRRFNDANGDRQVDQWCYFKDGIEIYRDIDSDFNATADQYRWLGTGGTRWGIDKNEDGTVDTWKMISPEEVTIELVEAIKTKDEDRFRRLLPSEQEIKQLGLGDEKAKQLVERVLAARTGFAEFARSQKLVQSTTKWAHFAADKPGVVPAGTDGATQDVVAYENVISIIDNDGTSQQLMVGTLVQLGATWKLADLPKSVSDGATIAESGFFFPSTVAAGGRPVTTQEGSSGMTGEMQSLLSDLEKIDTQIRAAAGDNSKLSQLHDERAQTMVRLINASKGTSEMELWVRQFVDSVSSAAMQGEYSEGLERLQSFEAQLPNIPGGKDLMPYVAYRVLTTDYQVKSLGENVNFAKLQGDHMENLEAYVEKYSESPDAADAMIQIALNHELTGEEKEAQVWYKKVADGFPSTNEGKKASGAIARLSLEGRTFSLSGKTLDGKTFDSKQFAGMPVVIQYWASWCEPCKQDMKKIREELAKNPKAFGVVGVNLDSDREKAATSIPAGFAPWPHIHEGSGFESDLAVGLGVLSVPVTILVDRNGKVIKRGAHFTQDMEDALKALTEGAPDARAAKLPSQQPAPSANKSNAKTPSASPTGRPVNTPGNRPANGTTGGQRPPQRPGSPSGK